MNFILIILTISLNYSAEIKYITTQDSIFIGEKATLKIIATHLKKNEFAIFPKIDNNNNNYSLNSLIYEDTTATYQIQFWESGIVSIHPMDIIIMKNKVETNILKTDTINYVIHTNINTNTNSLKKIKPMKDVNLIDNNKFIILSIIILCALIILFFSYTSLTRIISINKNQAINNNNHYKVALKEINDLSIPVNYTISEVEKYYADLSSFLKKYIKNKYFIKSTEMTTSELTNYFKKNNFKINFIAEWESTSKKSDLIKFSGKPPLENSFYKDKKSFIYLLDTLEKIDKL